MRRHLLGLISLGLMVAGLVGIFLVSSEDQAAASICLRVGLVLGAVWLALPQLVQLRERVSPLTMAIICSGGLAVLFPRYLAVLLPIIGILLGLQFVGWILKKEG